MARPAVSPRSRLELSLPWQLLSGRSAVSSTPAASRRINRCRASHSKLLSQADLRMPVAGRRPCAAGMGRNVLAPPGLWTQRSILRARPPCPRKHRRSVARQTSQTRTVAWKEPLAKSWPSGEKATLRTYGSCPRRQQSSIAPGDVPDPILAAVAVSPMWPSTRATWSEAATSVDWVTFRELATTLKPRSTNALTMPAPMPCEAPVTMAVFRWLLMGGTTGKKLVV